MEIDQRSIVIFLSMQGKSPTVIEKEMKDTLGEIAVKYSTITKYLRQTKFPPSSDKPENDEYLNVLDKVDQIILDVLDEQPFASIRQIAQRAGIPKSTVHYHLTVILNFKNMNLKWVPHSLTDEQKAKRILISKQLLKKLRSAKHHSWNYFLTGDESWFYLSYEHERMWVESGDEPQTRSKKMIGDEKVLVSVFWNPNGFALVDELPKGVTFTTDYFINNILEKLTKRGTAFPDRDGKRLNLHFDNARPHTADKTIQYMELNGLKKVPHPPYSPDIAPSDFFLFGYTKDKLQGCSFNTREELLDAIRQIWAEIPKATLREVFLEWEKRLQKVIDTDGNYI